MEYVITAPMGNYLGLKHCLILITEMVHCDSYGLWLLTQSVWIQILAVPLIHFGQITFLVHAFASTLYNTVYKVLSYRVVEINEWVNTEML